MLPETLGFKSAELKALLESSTAMWERRTGAQRRPAGISGDVTETMTGGVETGGALAELNTPVVMSAVGWLGWVVSWLPG